MVLNELTSTLAVEITVCNNLELIADGRNLSEAFASNIVDEATDAAGSVIIDELGESPGFNSTFRDWQGGKFYHATCGKRQATLLSGYVAANFYTREIERDDDGEIMGATPWRWQSVDDTRHGSVRHVEGVLERADAALEAVLARNEFDPILCHFCPASVEDVTAAIDADWSPSFFNGDDEISAPVCPSCADRHLKTGESGELELIHTD